RVRRVSTYKPRGEKGPGVSSRMILSPRISQDDEVFQARDGLLDLPALLYSSDDPDNRLLPDYELVFTISGYRPLRTRLPADCGIADDSIPVLKCRPALARTLR